MPVLTSKLLEEIRLLIVRGIKDGNWNTDQLLKCLREEVRNRDRCTGIQAVLPTANISPRKPRELETAAALLTGETKHSTSNCTFCKRYHASTNCHVVTNRAVRKQILRKEGRCFICLKQNYLAEFRRVAFRIVTLLKTFVTNYN